MEVKLERARLAEALKICEDEDRPGGRTRALKKRGAFYRKHGVDVTRTVEAAARKLLNGEKL